MASASRILVVDDDTETTLILCRILTQRGYVARAENDSRVAVETLRAFKPDLVILDFEMPHCHGGDVAWQLFSDPLLRSTKLLVCSGSSYEEILACMPPVQVPFLAKPVDADVLIQQIESSLGADAEN